MINTSDENNNKLFRRDIISSIFDYMLSQATGMPPVDCCSAWAGVCGRARQSVAARYGGAWSHRPFERAKPAVMTAP